MPNRPRAAALQLRETTVCLSPLSVKTSSSTAMRCARWLIGSRLTPTCTRSWSRAVASWCSSGTSGMTMRFPAAYVLGLAAIAPPGQAFFYNTGALTLLSAIMRKATGRPLDEFARAALLYGYLWWLGRSRPNGREVHWVGALGRGGQSIRIVPELDLVVVVTAGYYQDYSRQAFQVQYGIFRDILHAISSPGR